MQTAVTCNSFAIDRGKGARILQLLTSGLSPKSTLATANDASNHLTFWVKPLHRALANAALSTSCVFVDSSKMKHYLSIAECHSNVFDTKRSTFSISESWEILFNYCQTSPLQNLSLHWYGLKLKYPPYSRHNEVANRSTKIDRIAQLAEEKSGLITRRTAEVTSGWDEQGYWEFNNAIIGFGPYH